MTTSPYESRPSGVSAIVVPDALRPRIDDFLRSLGCTVEPFPWSHAPVPMFIAMPEDERKSLHDMIDLGRSTSPVDLGLVQHDPADLWTPVSTEPGLRPLPDPHRLPVYRTVRLGLTCYECSHDHDQHNGYAYAPPLGPTRTADVTVVVCLVDECACLTHLAPPTPV